MGTCGRILPSAGSWPVLRKPGFSAASPNHSRKRAAGPTGRRRHRTPEIGVRLPGGPLYAVRDSEGPMVQGDDVALAWRRSGFDSRWVHSNGRESGTVCRAVLLRRFPREGNEGSNPLPSAPGPDGETEDHASLLTRSFGFESWSGY